MKKQGILRSIPALAMLLALSGAPKPPAPYHSQAQGSLQITTPISAPALQWQHGGCYSSWCETGWYSSPAVADLYGDGSIEVIGAAYSLFVLNGEDGSLEWSVNPPGGRVWPGVVVADIDDNGDLEIAVAQGSGYISVYDHEGNTEPNWPRRPTNNELRGLASHDLDDDGSLEIVVTGAVNSRTNTWVYEHDGTLRPGWPQLSNDSGYAWGVFNDNAAVADIDGDGTGEIIVPSDVHYICAYEPNGSHIPAHAMYGAKNWGQVGVWESPVAELQGWGTCDEDDGREERNRANFAHGPATIADVNGDDILEVVVVGNVYDCIPGYPSQYNGPFIFNSDRSRFVADGYDWQTAPQDTGSPLSEDWNTIENNQPNPAVADLDGDGEQEIIYASYDGYVHAFWLDKTEHANWPYAVYTGGPYRFASEPAVADLDNDGFAEVIFASWVQKHSGLTGRLHIVSHQGLSLHQVDLPAALGDQDWNGALAAPTLANIDADSDLEVVLNTAHSGLVAYNLPGTANARILWGTGRGNYQRTGSLLYGSLQTSTKHVLPIRPDPGGTLTYTIALHNPGPTLYGARVTDTLPTEVTYLGNLWASSGSYGEAGSVITWTGSVSAGESVAITFGVTVSQQISTPYAIANTAQINDGMGNIWERMAVAIISGHVTDLPLVLRQINP